VAVAIGWFVANRDVGTDDMAAVAEIAKKLADGTYDPELEGGTVKASTGEEDPTAFEE
jgi:hypothetical protein